MFSSISSSLASLVIFATKAPVGISTPGFGGALPEICVNQIRHDKINKKERTGLGLS